MIADIHSNGWDDYSFARVAYCDFDKSLNGLSINEIAARPDRSAAQITAASWSPARRSDHQERKSANPEPAQSESSLERQTDVVIQLFARGGAQMVFFDMAEDDVLTIMREPGVMFGSDSAVREESTSAIPHPRGLGTFPRILGRYVRENHVLALEDAVRRMTSLPAKTFGLAQRGQIGVGYWADLVLFDPKTTIDQASYEHPLNYPVGIAYVIVNGSIVLDPYGPTSAAPGKALRFRPGNLDH
jgi:N-acyl-D-amino-acid deacylase